MPRDGKRLDRRNFLKAAGGATVAATLAGCAGGGGEETPTATETSTPGEETPTATETSTPGEETTVLTYSRGNGSGTLDPQNTTSGEDVKVTNQVYDTPIGFKPGTTQLTQGLAKSWNLSGTTATLTFREGVKFHNGDELTAGDFVATYRRFTDPDYEYYPGQGYTSAYAAFTLGSWIDTISTPSKYKVEMQLSQKYAPFLRNLAMFASSVLSETAIKNRGKGLQSHPVGTGPFQFVRWNTGNQRIRLEANPDYWGEGPHVDEVLFTAITSNTSRAQTLVTGGADIIDGLGAQSSQIVENASNSTLKSIPGINVGYMAMNMAVFEPFRDKKVRQAINYAINTKAIVNTIYRGIAQQASQPITEAVLGYNEDIDPYPYDPEKARSLLDEAGYTGDSRFGFELSTFQNPRTYNPSPIQAAQTVKSNLSEVGIEVTINQMPFNPFLSYTSSGKHDACFLGWMTDNADPDNFYYALLHPQLPEEDLPPEGQNWVDAWGDSDFNTLNVSAWAHSEYMQLVEEGQTTYDPKVRAQKYRQAAQIFHEQAPWVTIDHAKALRGIRNNVQNFVVAPISGPFLNRVTLG
ncbi:MAG: ABC transporter substrate-binding protein [Halodesulfurarchaeum sp.]